jgi:hypothetical protein
MNNCSLVVFTGYKEINSISNFKNVKKPCLALTKDQLYKYIDCKKTSMILSIVLIGSTGT